MFKKTLDGYLKKSTILVVHLVFTTNYSRRLFTEIMIEQRIENFESDYEKSECVLSEINAEEDHVHILISYSPKWAISVMVNNLKSISPRYADITDHPPYKAK